MQIITKQFSLFPSYKPFFNYFAHGDTNARNIKVSFSTKDGSKYRKKIN